MNEFDRLFQKLDKLDDKQDKQAELLTRHVVQIENITATLGDIKAIQERHNKQLSTALLPIKSVKWLIGFIAGGLTIASLVRALGIAIGQ